MTAPKNTDGPGPTAMYQRPVEAKLIVRTEHGEEWEATPGDLEKFRAITMSKAYGRFLDAWQQALRVFGFDDIVEADLNPIRYVVECAICYPNLGSVAEHVGADVLDQIAEMEDRLQRYSQLHGDDDE